MTCFIRFFFFQPRTKISPEKTLKLGRENLRIFFIRDNDACQYFRFRGAESLLFFVRTRLSKFPRGHSNRGENVLKYSHRVRKLAEKRIIKGGERTEKKSSAIKTMGNQQFEDKSLTAPGGVAFRSTDRCGVQIGPG